VTQASNIPLWGRAWKLTVELTTGEIQVLSQDGWDPEALRLTFDVLQSSISSPFWFADVALYNANAPEMQSLLHAKTLILEAGYQSGPSKSSIIYAGPVLQTRFTRENVVDLVMRFNCLATDALLENNFINLAVGPMSSQYDVVSKMIGNMGGNVAEQVSSRARTLLAGNQYPRAKTLFGKATKFINEIADGNYVSHWIGANGQHYVSEMADPSKENPDLTYGPPFPPSYNPGASDSSITRSIIGVPEPSPHGCEFTVLLDPRLKVQVPPMLVKLDQTIIQQLKIQYGQLPLSTLDQSGLYIASQVRHYGDTRGNDWYTSVIGWRRAYAQLLLSGPPAS
jgi:hypothetical protein